MSNNRPHLNHVQLCPQCGAVALQGADSVIDTNITCEVCSFSGARNEFFVHFFQTKEKLESGKLLQQMSDSFAKTLMGAAAPEIGRWLHDWGFAYWDGPPRDREDETHRLQVMIRYAREIGKAVVESLLRVRRDIEAERVAHERKYS